MFQNFFVVAVFMLPCYFVGGIKSNHKKPAEKKIRKQLVNNVCDT